MFENGDGGSGGRGGRSERRKERAPEFDGTTALTGPAYIRGEAFGGAKKKGLKSNRSYTR